MATLGTHNDGLRLHNGADYLAVRVVLADLPGVVILSASARNGTGSGRVIMTGARWLSWMAPGSSTPGAVVDCSAGGNFMLEDGADISKWITVTVYPSYLPDYANTHVFIEDAYNGLGPDDVSATNASAGITETVQLSLSNVSANAIINAKLWIDPLAPATLYVSSDGTNFYQPTSALDAHVLTWASIGISASVSVWIRRVIGAAAANNPSVLNLLQWNWEGLN